MVDYTTVSIQKDTKELMDKYAEEEMGTTQVPYEGIMQSMLSKLGVEED